MVYKILVADDEPTMRRLMAVLLKRHNHEVIEASTGEDCLALAIEHQPDIILLDVIMPGVDGFETLRRLRANRETEDIPVIFLSAKGEVSDRVEGLRLGADDYVTKPAEPAELLARIDSVILRSRREARRSKGYVFGLLGAKGGVGKTTTLANLAVHFQQAGRSPLLVDMNLAFGNLAAHFGLDANRCSIANLTVIAPADLDLHQVQQVILEHSSGVRLIASPPNVPTWASYSADLLRTVVEQCAYSARYVFLDLPKDPDLLGAISEQISGLILVLGSEPSSLRVGEEIAKYLGNLGLHDRLSAILVHRAASEYQLVDAGTIAERLGCLVLGTIPFKPDIYMRAEYDQSPVLLKAGTGADNIIFEKIGTRLLNYVETLEQFQKQKVYGNRRLV
ncbi:MAG: response regulator [Caldilineaceae bacterium]|nr:response regulator [Caldilineaceae bacterium]